VSAWQASTSVVTAGDVAGWLERRRAHVAAAAALHGLPAAVRVSVPVWVRDAAGREVGGHEERDVSALNHDVVGRRVWAVSAPWLDEEAIGLAEGLAAGHEGAIRFHAETVPARRIEQDLAHPAVLGDPDAPTPVVFALDLLHRALRGYLRGLASLDRPDPLRARRVGTELVRCVAAPTWTMLASVPVGGLDPVADPMRRGWLGVRELDAAEAGHVGGHHLPDSHLPGGRFDLRWLSFSVGVRHVLEVRVAVDKRDECASKPVWRFTKKALLALELLGFPLHGPGYAVAWWEPEWLGSGVRAMPVDIPRHRRSDPRRLGAGDLAEAVGIAERIPDGAVEWPRTPAEVALHRLALASARRSAADALIDRVVALEALLLAGLDPKIKVGNIKQYFCRNGSAWITAGRDPEAVADGLAAIYGLRSRLVHGEHPPDPEVLAAAADDAGDLARAGLLRALHEGWPTGQTFDRLARGAGL
jgi:hypothetical protein